MPPNRLAESSSAYLRSASHQPIDWYEFSDEAFRVAHEMDRPILLDIGAVWCHWCHVIDRESYENNEIANLINQHYIAVKVDRDQRPDVDSRYQQVIASLTGQGGWPLTAFLTPDGRVLFGGTYFPPQTMKKLLNQIKDVYHEQKAEILKETLDRHIHGDDEFFEKTMVEAGEGPATTLSETLLQGLSNAANKSFDTLHGGFGMMPKFPHFSALEYLILHAFHTNDTWHQEMIERTLTEMANGGIIDQIGGGFHRYATDRNWHVPHFEKMAYDNAEALGVYAQAYRLHQTPLYLEIIEGILRFTGEVLSDQGQGGFYASQDADINLEDDGDYFTWTLDEVKAVLPPAEALLAIAYYDISATGDMHERPGRNVLRVDKSLKDLSRQLAQPVDVLAQTLARAKAKLAEHRLTRPTPFIDNTIYLNWNGMMLVGYFQVADLLNRKDVLDFACKTLDRLLETHVNPQRDRLLHVDGIPGFIEDYAWMIQALLMGYQSTGNPAYLEQAIHWADVAHNLFEDKLNGGFFDTDGARETAVALLKFRRKPIEDTPSTSPNAVMIRSFWHLHLLTGRDDYKASVERALTFYKDTLASHGLFVAGLGIALMEYLKPPLKLEILGQNPELTAAARQVFYPGKLLSYQPDAATAEVRICIGTQCYPPVSTVEELQSRLKELLPSHINV